METSSTTGQEESTNGINGVFNLQNILGENNDIIEHPGTQPAEPATGWDQEETEKPLQEGYCVECEGEHRLLINREYDIEF